ncbi:MAG: cation diffusion facilitator family transporter [Chloroflexi bacterium]|nr:cation diffusion facilitator family transporter [Chloroflexota bacterium]
MASTWGRWRSCRTYLSSRPCREKNACWIAEKVVGGGTLNASTRGAGQRGLYLALGLYAVIFALKLWVYVLSGVLVLLAEALHTLTDVFVSGFLLAAAVISHREADRGHMFGHGRAQNVGALIAATLFVTFTAFQLYQEGVGQLISPSPESHRNLPLVAAVLGVSMVLAAVPLLNFLRQGRSGAAARAQMLELVNDELALVAALVGTFFIAMGQPIADPIATIIVATIITVNAGGLLAENARVLIGGSPGPEFFDKVAAIARTVPGVLDVHTMRAEYVGPDDVHTTMHIEVAKGMPIEQADRIAEEVRRAVCGATNSNFCDIHVDPSTIESRLLEEEPPGRG